MMVKNSGWLCFCIIAIGRVTAATALDWTPECASVVVVPDGVTRIRDSAFARCSSLTSITLPNSVTKIGKYAFAYCSSLTSITAPNSVTTIGEMAFYGCSSLTSISLPNRFGWDGDTTIGKYAFENCRSTATRRRGPRSLGGVVQEL